MPKALLDWICQRDGQLLSYVRHVGELQNMNQEILNSINFITSLGRHRSNIKRTRTYYLAIEHLNTVLR